MEVKLNTFLTLTLVVDEFPASPSSLFINWVSALRSFWTLGWVGPKVNLQVFTKRKMSGIGPGHAYNSHPLHWQNHPNASCFVFWTCIDYICYDRGAWETIRETIKISAKESLGYFKLKKHKPWFSEGCTKLLDQRKQDNCSGYRIQVK
jgi:hypothetical protein